MTVSMNESRASVIIACSCWQTRSGAGCVSVPVWSSGRLLDVCGMVLG